MPLGCLSPEARLIFLSAGGPENDQALADLLADDLRPDRLAALATRENATAILRDRLRAVGPELRDSPTLQGLERLAMVAEFRQSYLAERLEETLFALRQAGIETLLLKGAALAVSVYDGLRQRPMWDLDLLVQGEQAAAAQQVLAGTGWMLARGLEPADAAVRYRLHHHLPPMVDARGTGLSVELHTDLFPMGHPFRFGAPDIWSRASEASFSGEPVRIPHPHHTLLHTCLHFAWSHWLQLGAWRTFRDIGALARAGLIGWEELAELAARAGGASCSYWTFRLARTLANAPVPSNALAALRPSHSAVIMKILERHFACGLLAEGNACPSHYLQSTLWELAIQPRRAGHGSIRPWHLTPLRPGVATGRRLHALPRHLSNLARWRRYLSVLFLDRPAFGQRAPRGSPVPRS